MPCFLRWPGRIAAGTEDKSARTAMDLLPTIAAAAGAPLPADRPIDGKSLPARLRRIERCFTSGTGTSRA